MTASNRRPMAEAGRREWAFAGDRRFATFETTLREMTQRREL
jgi:hypothetical protein